MASPYQRELAKRGRYQPPPQVKQDPILASLNNISLGIQNLVELNRKNARISDKLDPAPLHEGIAHSGVKEALKNMMFQSNSPQCDNHFEKNLPCPSDILGAADIYLDLDGVYKNVAGTNLRQGIIGFNINNEATTGKQAIGTFSTLENIIEIVVGNFYLPAYQDLTDTAAGTTFELGPKGQTENQFALEYGIIKAEIIRMDRQTNSISGVGDRYHVSFHAKLEVPEDILPDPPLPGEPVYNRQVRPRFRLTPEKDRDRFIFTTPINTLDDFSIRFHGQTKIMPLLNDVFYNVGVTAGSPVIFTYSNHGLLTGDVIQFKDFKASSPTNQINTALGNWNLATVTVIDVDTFSLSYQPENGAVIPLDDDGPITFDSTVDLIMPWRRIQIPVRVRKVVDQLTNYINPGSR
jgi:hypothetical protein